MSLTGCSLFGGGDQIKQANNALKKGNPTQAIKVTKGLLVLYPRNIRAKRMLTKIEGHLMQEAEDALQAEDYKLALSKVSIVLDKLNPENAAAQTVQRDAKKNIQLAAAQMFMAAENPVGALKTLNAALNLDPNFKEALDLKAEVEEVVEERISAFLSSAEEMMDQGKYVEVETMAQDILAIAPQNREVAELLHKAKAEILAKDKEKNLELARKFFEQGLYESAKEKAELVLQVDAESEEAKELVENCKAELLKPDLRLTGFLTIKGTVYASIMIGEGSETHRVQEGEVFGDFKISAIDRDLGAVVVTYNKTGSQQTLMKE
jgi:tetratricopeptide (TPR) repeat protein